MTASFLPKPNQPNSGWAKIQEASKQLQAKVDEAHAAQQQRQAEARPARRDDDAASGRRSR
jgi:hypothetical protein